MVGYDSADDRQPEAAAVGSREPPARELAPHRQELVGRDAHTAVLHVDDDVLPFAVICVASGAALGADLTLLPALFARRLEAVSPGAGAGFGLWSFVSKLTLAFAAVGLLPLLQARGFVSGGDNTEAALWLLTVLYALVPCALKFMAIALLAATKIPEA
jgi:hypothetical protein